MTTVANVRTYPGPMANAVYVGRPSMYGNPYKIGNPGTRAEAIALFRIWWMADLNIDVRRHAVEQLKDKVLLCWCAPQACHADVIAEYVNAQVGS